MLRVAIVVISSKIASGQERDAGREMLEPIVKDLPGELIAYATVPDDRTVIRERLKRLCDGDNPDIILTVGGTGIRPTDWAPEATRDVIEKEIPGIAEAMRLESSKKIKTAMLSRGTAGIRGTTLIVNLPGSPSAAKENLAVIQPVLDYTTVQKVSGSKSFSR